MNLKTGTPQASYRRHSHSDSPGLLRAQPRLRLRGSGAPRGGLGAGSLQDPAFRPEASFLLLFYFFFLVCVCFWNLSPSSVRPSTLPAAVADTPGPHSAAGSFGGTRASGCILASVAGTLTPCLALTRPFSPRSVPPLSLFPRPGGYSLFDLGGGGTSRRTLSSTPAPSPFLPSSPDCSALQGD